MLSFETYEILARMLHHESDNRNDQIGIMWSVINRIFSTRSWSGISAGNNIPNTLHSVITYTGAYHSIWYDRDSSNRSYRPHRTPSQSSYNGWVNCKLLAATLYTLVGEETMSTLDRNKIESFLSRKKNTIGTSLRNKWGDANSFWGDGIRTHFTTA